MTGIKAGDEVRVYDVNSAPARRGQHDPGEPGKVVKVGRTLVHIEYFHRTETFRIEDGRRNDNYGHQWFLTLEQAEVKDRRRAAEDALRSVGLQFTSSGRRDSLTLEQIEALAEVARSFSPEEGTGR